MHSTLHKWYVLTAAGIIILLTNVDVTIVNLAVADIAMTFNASINAAQWIIVSYLLATAICFILFGKAADLLGKRFIFLLGVGIFLVASLACGISQNITQLIIARFLQGIGFAASLGMSIVLIVNAFPIQQRGLAAGLAMTIAGLSQVIGPPLGGVLLHYTTWHWIFLINVPLCLISFFMSLKVIPCDEPVAKTQVLDYAGIVLYVVGLATLLISLNQLALLSTLQFILLLTISIILLTVFLRRCFFVKNPLIDTVVLRHRGYLTVVIIRVLFMFSQAGLLFSIPLYLQNILGFSALYSGLLLLSMTALIAVASIPTGKALDKFGFKWLVFLSMIGFIISWLLLLQLTQSISLLVLITGLAVFGVGIGMHAPSTINGVMKQIEPENSGTAVGLFYTSAISGAAMGAAIAGSIIGVQSKAALSQALAQHKLVIAPDTMEILIKIANGTHAPLNHASALNLPVELLNNLAQTSFVSAFHTMMVVNLLLICVGAVLALRLRT